MILPDKYVTTTESFLGISALILEVLSDKKMAIDKLWSNFNKSYIKTNKINNPPTYQKFIYVLEFMFLADMITYNTKGEIMNENN